MIVPDMTGKRFGMWTVLYRVENDKTGCAMWRCRCDCGTERDVHGGRMRAGGSKSCGCITRKHLRPPEPKHGMCGSRIYDIWGHMKQRCINSDSQFYADYGGRGIKLCAEWNKFENFYEWSMANGYSDDLSIDRINNNGNYEPANCRWADRFVQQNNRRVNRRIEINGETHTVAEWARIAGVKTSLIRGRLIGGWTGEKLLIPPMERGSWLKHGC